MMLQIVTSSGAQRYDTPYNRDEGVVDRTEYATEAERGHGVVTLSLVITFWREYDEGFEARHRCAVLEAEITEEELKEVALQDGDGEVIVKGYNEASWDPESKAAIPYPYSVIPAVFDAAMELLAEKIPTTRAVLVDGTPVWKTPEAAVPERAEKEERTDEEDAIAAAAEEIGRAIADKIDLDAIAIDPMFGPVAADDDPNL